MARKKTTVDIDEELLKVAKISATRTGKEDCQVFEEALRQYLGLRLLEQACQRSKLWEEEALRLAYRELHRSRRR